MVVLRKLVGGREKDNLSGEDPGTPETRQAYKLRVAAALHREADARHWCSDFDRVMESAGLPVRTASGFIRQNVEAELTAEEFEAWREKARRVLNFAGRRRNVAGYEKVLRDLGLGGEVRTVEAKVRGTFEVTMNVQVMRGTDPRQGLDAVELRNLIFRDMAAESERITWDVELPD